jgi:hypothetical protein
MKRSDLSPSARAMSDTPKNEPAILGWLIASQPAEDGATY